MAIFAGRNSPNPTLLKRIKCTHPKSCFKICFSVRQQKPGVHSFFSGVFTSVKISPYWFCNFKLRLIIQISLNLKTEALCIYKNYKLNGAF